MANHEIDKKYSEELRKIETTDLVHADTVNPLYGQLINNDAYLKEKVNEHQAETLQDGVHGIATTQDVTYYVDAINGNDTNDGFSSATAFQTIGKAIELIPMIVNHTITLKIADGTYNEAINIKNKYGEGLISFDLGTNVVIAGVVDAASSSFVKTSFLLQRMNVNIIFNNNININPSGDLGSSAFTAIDVVSSHTYNSIRFNFDANNVTTTGSKRGITSSGAITYIFQCDINNSNIACLASRNGRIHVSNATGTGNETVLDARQGGVISKEGTMPEGATAERTEYGGVIR